MFFCGKPFQNPFGNLCNKIFEIMCVRGGCVESHLGCSYEKDLSKGLSLAMLCDCFNSLDMKILVQILQRSLWQDLAKILAALSGKGWLHFYQKKMSKQGSLRTTTRTTPNTIACHAHIYGYIWYMVIYGSILRLVVQVHMFTRDLPRSIVSKTSWGRAFVEATLIKNQNKPASGYPKNIHENVHWNADTVYQKEGNDVETKKTVVHADFVYESSQANKRSRVDDVDPAWSALGWLRTSSSGFPNPHPRLNCKQNEYTNAVGSMFF